MTPSIKVLFDSYQDTEQYLRKQLAIKRNEARQLMTKARDTALQLPSMQLLLAYTMSPKGPFGQYVLMTEPVGD